MAHPSPLTIREADEPAPEPPEYVKLHAAAKRVGCSYRTIRRYVDAGRLPAHRLGPRGDFRVRVTDVDALLTPVTVTRAVEPSAADDDLDDVVPISTAGARMTVNAPPGSDVNGSPGSAP